MSGKPVDGVVQALIDVAVGKVQHLFRGTCPDAIEGFDSRDPQCPACLAVTAAQQQGLRIVEPIRNCATPGSREAAMVVLETDEEGNPTIWCDPEVADLVRALNVGGVRTVASCSGHGERLGSIALADGRALVICSSPDEAIAVIRSHEGPPGSTNMEHVEVLERLRGVLEHGKMGDKCLIAPDLVTAAIASLSAPPPADAEPKTLPVPTRVYLTDKAAVIVGDPQRGWDEEGPEAHNCDDMGCSSIGPHVLARVPFTDERAMSQPAEARGGVDDLIHAASNAATIIRNCVNAREIGEGYAQHADDIDAAIAALSQQPAAPSGEAGAFDANFLQSVASLCRAAYDLCQPKPQRTPEDPREHYGELCLLELASIADEIERRLAAADAAQQPAAVDGVVGTVLRRDNRDGSEVLDHQIDLDPEFDERLNNMPAGTVVRLYAAPVRDLTLKQLADVAALAAQHQEPKS